MALPPPERTTVTEDDLTPLVAVLDELAAEHGGWVNLRPEVDDGTVEPPQRNPLVALFSARGEAVPLLTWLAPEHPGDRASLGITHGSGPKALVRLAQIDLGLPPGWLRRTDHPRRGLVVTVPGDEDHGEVLWWMLAAGHALSTIPLGETWHVEVHRPRR